ncbi:hypothetical protein V9T40_010801 [Parthenolecanium corni]|uniref:Transmembrane protein n=1 Tax=Parthenolecanium corni TaxID=536013 RepID=A0AAN9XYX9_9HEMI
MANKTAPITASPALDSDDENQPLKVFVYYGLLLLSLIFLGIGIFLMMSGKKEDDGCGATCVVSKKGKKKTRTVIIS